MTGFWIRLNDTESSEACDSENEIKAPENHLADSEMLEALDTLRKEVQFRATDFSPYYKPNIFIFSEVADKRQHEFLN